jgi:UMF1 family MFS transporter
MAPADSIDAGRREGWLEKLALRDPAMRAWAFYDFANSSLFTVVITAVFPIYFASVIAADLTGDEKRVQFGWATTASLLVAALISPPLGAFADFRRVKKRLLSLFAGIGIVATAGMFWLGPGTVDLALALFALANIGAAGSFVFYDALLPHVASGRDMDRLSTSGYALGYLGGGLCLAISLAMIQRPAWFGFDAAEDPAGLAARASFVLVAVWWAAFSIPLLRRVSEPDVPLERDESSADNAVRVAFRRLAETFRELRSYKQAFLLLVAFLVYNDGIGTIVRMAVLFGEERHIERSTMIAAILLAQFTGIPCTILFGRLAVRTGAKLAILVSLVAYVGITLLAFHMDTATEFLAMAGLVGVVQGGAQSLSRSLFASLVPRHKSAEFFGLFSTLEKFAGVLGPLVFTASATSGNAILALIGFFVVGGAVLCFVDVEAGRAAAAAADRELAG